MLKFALQIVGIIVLLLAATLITLKPNINHMTHSAPKLVINRWIHSTRFIALVAS